MWYPLFALTGVRRTICAIVVVLFSCCPFTRAQTTQPAENSEAAGDPWQRAVEGFALATFDRDNDLARSMVSDSLSLASFDGSKVRGLAEAMHEIGAGKLVTVRAYQTVPQTLANDLAKDVEASKVVPDEKKKQFAPDGESAMRHANQTAAEWVRRSLEIEGSTGLVGLIMVWEPASVSEPGSHGGPVFMLIRGEVGDAHAPAFQISRIVVGSPTKG